MVAVDGSTPGIDPGEGRTFGPRRTAMLSALPKRRLRSSPTKFPYVMYGYQLRHHPFFARRYQCGLGGSMPLPFLRGRDFNGMWAKTDKPVARTRSRGRFANARPVSSAVP